MRTRHAVFPGLTIARLFQIESGPLHEEITNNIINLGWRAPRSVAPAGQPCARPQGDRPLQAGDARVPRPAARRPAGGRDLRVHRGDRKAVSLAGDRRVDGRATKDAPALYRWSNWIQRQFDPVSLTTEREEIERAVSEFYAYEDALIAARRQTLGQDLISELIRPNKRATGCHTTSPKPDSEHPCRRCRHQSEPTRSRRQAARRTSRPVTAALPTQGSGACRGRGGASLRAGNAVHGAHHRR